LAGLYRGSDGLDTPPDALMSQRGGYNGSQAGKRHPGQEREGSKQITPAISMTMLGRRAIIGTGSKRSPTVTPEIALAGHSAAFARQNRDKTAPFPALGAANPSNSAALR